MSSDNIKLKLNSMEKKGNIKSLEDIYQDSQDKITKLDKIELITDFINKLKQVIHQGQFIIETLGDDINKD